MKNNYCTIYLVRHGLTDWNEKGIVQGNTDIPLNLEGEVQAKNLAKELRDIKFYKVFSSDLLRAKRTAEIIALEHKLDVETTKVLRERNFGALEGQPNERVKELQRIIASLEESKRFSYKQNPSMESDGEIVERMLKFLREVAISNPGKNILIVTHGGTMRVLLIKLGEFTHKDRVSVNNLAYVKLDSDGIDFFVKELKGIDVNI